jgi:(1->4)-alpha-D-glucan 1-alpha-D-glucosylmutase
MVPRATYRLQFGQKFGFDAAAAIAPYLAELGISHVYASPYLQARPGSAHGYDITKHDALNPELGGEEAFQRMVRSFCECGLEHILDYVPNHMGVGGSDNPLWLDVLEWGSASPYAAWFDIDWDSPSEYLHGKLLVPFLGDQYGAELKAGRLELKFDKKEGAFSVWLYGTHKLPVTPSSYPLVLSHEVPELKKFAVAFGSLKDSRPDILGRAAKLKAELAESVANNAQLRAAFEKVLESFRGVPGQLASWAKLDELIRLQHWRPTHFRVAADVINYRRFFNISELAGIRMELPEVFEHTHRLVLRLLKDGSLQGLRIDHIDGLYNPKAYLEHLRASAGPSFYLVVEKILSRHESLRRDWPVDGTTGYEFCAQATALLVDPAAGETLTRFYREFTGESQPFPEIVRGCKLKILENELRSELETLSREALRVARQNPCTTDFTQNILRRALKETIASFPVYRTYVDGSELNETDERYIHWAIAQAVKNEKELDKSVFEFLEKLLTGRLAQQSDGEFQQAAALRCAMKAQQLSGPVMAKGLEDTAIYRYNRFIALSEVGSPPDQFGLPLSVFHKENAHRAENWPRTMLATSTHDVKHGEDARARLAALSLQPEEWVAKVSAWSRIVRARRGDVEGTAPPAHNDEYLFFQNLVATWPAELTLPQPMDSGVLAQYVERLQRAMVKSLREARVRSNWISPDESYENAVAEFIRDALNPEISHTFLENFLPFQQHIAELGVRNSLVQILLKITSPGVADFYQGSELWDLNLPDPDNRRPVAFDLRQRLLKKLADAGENPGRAWFCTLLRDWHDGGIKLAAIQRLLQFRRGQPELFEKGNYEPLRAAEDPSLPLRVCAFRRTLEQQTFIAVASLDARLTSEDCSGASVNLGQQADARQWRDVLTNATVGVKDGSLELRDAFFVLPIAFLVPQT